MSTNISILISRHHPEDGRPCDDVIVTQEFDRFYQGSNDSDDPASCDPCGNPVVERDYHDWCQQTGNDLNRILWKAGDSIYLNLQETEELYGKAIQTYIENLKALYCED